MQPLWVRVDANRTKLAVFVVLFVLGSSLLLTLALVAVPGSLLGIVFADGEAWWRGLALAVGGAFLLLLLAGSLAAAVQIANAEDWVRARFAGRPLSDTEEPQLRSAVNDMALAAGLTAAPTLVLLEIDSVNAFALGATRRAPVIGVTRGFLGALDADEQRAVIATLTARILAGDIMFGTALAALMGPLKAVRESRRGAGSVAATAADAGCSNPGCSDEGCGCLFDALSDSDSPGGCGGAIALVLFVALVAALTYVAVVCAAWIVTLWGRALQRTNYEKADAEGMLLLKDPTPMLSALAKAATSSTAVADGDASYDGVFYAPTSGTPRVERVERRRYDRLREVLGTEGLAAPELPVS